MKRWLDPVPVLVPAELREAIGGHPVISETLVRRGIRTIEAARAFLDPANYVPADEYDLPDMARGVERAAEAIRKQQQVLIWGDFDVDGQTATTLLVSIFEKLGLKVHYYIPDRHREGHGIHTEKLRSLISEHGLNLVITCDTGISEHDAVLCAKSLEVDVIITDHHQLPAELPEAYACINPQRLDAEHPLATLPGVGCAYKFAEALVQSMGQSRETLQCELELVALGIVADVALQTADTRYLLQCGLAELRQTSRPGLLALLRTIGLPADQLSESDIAFMIAPRLNSLGRLGDANQAVSFLRTSDTVEAEVFANRLEALNNERKLLERQVFDSAVGQIEQDPSLLEHSVLVLWHRGWPGGVLGIAANRLVEIYKRPVLLLNVDDEGTARGSARSSEGIDITAAIASCSHLLTGYGGHVMAAGVNLSADALPEFRRCLSRNIQSDTKAAVIRSRVDADLPLRDLSLELVYDLQRLAPFGAGNPALTFRMRNVRVIDHKTLGRDQSHLRLMVKDRDNEVREVTCWRTAIDEIPSGPMDLLFSISENIYKGNRSLMIEYLESYPLDIEADSRRGKDRSEVTYIDWRQEGQGESDAQKLLKLRAFLAEHHDAVVWCEGRSLEGIDTVTRAGLTPSQILVLCTPPPSREITRLIFDTVKPETVAIAGFTAEKRTSEALLKQVGGIAHYAIRKYDGILELSKAAAVAATTHDVIQIALMWFAARGDLVVTGHQEEGFLTLKAGDDQKYEAEQGEYLARLKLHLDEIAAYRSYFLRTEPNKLFEV